MPALVRGLWGDATLKRRNYDVPDAFADVLRNARDATQHATDVVYCFGESNRDYLLHVGFEDVRMIDPKPWCTPKVKDYISGSGAIRYGYSYWWHKLWIWQRAVAEFGEIMWLDMRAENTEPITEEYWERRRQGADFQAALYFQKNFSWGAPWRYDRWKLPDVPRTEDKQASQTVPGCGVVYLRGRLFVEHCLSLFQHGRKWVDHTVCAAVLDQRYGGWIGVEEYVAKGHWLDEYAYGRTVLDPTRETWIVRKRPSRPK